MASANRGALFQQIGRLYQEGTLSGLDDGQLLERYLTRRDEAAFETLVHLHGPMVLALCRRVLRDPRDIEDAFQATFLILVRKAPTIRDRDLLSNWLYGVAYRVARRARANTLRRRGREIAVAILETPSNPEASDVWEIGPILDQELNRLPHRYRAPIILCYFRGHTHDQAAEVLQCPVGTIRSRLARGRDLLRRRLTSRGHAPTAAMLGPGAAVPAGLLTEAVPAPLVSTTIKVCLEIGTTEAIHAGTTSASAMALTQGVLATMKTAQVKLIGMAILATGLSAGGVVAVSVGAGQNPKGVPGRQVVVPVKAAAPQENTIPAPAEVSKQSALEERLQALEKKLDELLSRAPSGTTLPAQPQFTTKDSLVTVKGFLPGSPVTAQFTAKDSGISKEPVRHAADSARIDAVRRRESDQQFQSIQELEVELELALLENRFTQKLVEQKAISTAERDRKNGKISIAKAKLEGRYDQLSDEIDRLKLEIKRKHAEREKVKAQVEVANSVIARNIRLNERKAGMVGAEDVAKAEWEMKSAAAQVAIVEVEIAEVELRVRQFERQQTRIRQLLKPLDAQKSSTER